MRGKPAGSFCCGLKIPTCSAQQRNLPVQLSTDWNGSVSTTRKKLSFSQQNADKHRAAAYKLVKESKAYRDFTPREQRDDATVKKGIADRARAQSSEGIDQRSNAFRDLSLEESDRRATAGEPFAVA